MIHFSSLERGSTEAHSQSLLFRSFFWFIRLMRTLGKNRIVDYSLPSTSQRFLILN